MRSAPRLAVLVVLAALAFPAPARDGSAPPLAPRVAPERLADLTLKILASDRNLEHRAGARVNVAIVFSKEDRVEAEALLGAFRSREATAVVGGVGFSTSLVPWEGGDGLRQALVDVKAAGLVVIGLPLRDLPRVSQVTRDLKVLTLSPVKESVGPLSLAAVVERGSVRVYRSDAALVEEGVSLSADFLALTRAR